MSRSINVSIRDKDREHIELLMKAGRIEKRGIAAFFREKLAEEALRIDPHEKLREAKEEVVRLEKLCAQCAHIENENKSSAFKNLVNRFDEFALDGPKNEADEVEWVRDQGDLLKKAGFNDAGEALKHIKMALENDKRDLARQKILERYKSKYGGEKGVRTMFSMPGHKMVFENAGFRSDEEAAAWCKSREGQ